MPPKNAKQSKGGALKKEQVAEKVKEIQKRQQNWLRQRDDHLKNGPESSSEKKQEPSGSGQPAKTTLQNGNKKLSNGFHGADILQVHNSASRDLSSQVSEKLNVKVKHGFGAWLQSRKNASEESEDGRVNGMHHEEKQRKEPDTKTLKEEHSTLSTTSHRSSHRNYPLSPAEFDTLADSIASRVKQDLGIRNGHAGSRNHDGRVMAEEGLQRGKTFVQDETDTVRNSCRVDGGGGGGSGDGDENGVVDVSSHRCAFCSSLMATSQHAPTLLVPCGHTVCKLCATSHNSCRLCGTKVASLTTNIMLQQIINEFHRKKGAQASHNAKVEATWERQEAQAALPPKTTAVQREVNYSSQLHNLRDRQAALEEEASSRRRERDRATSKVKRAEQQLNAILRQESGLMEQLRAIEEKLRDLRHHKEEYAGEVRQLQEEQRTATEQVTQVERTLKSLGEEIDKVQFLSEGQKDMYTKQRIHRR